MRAKDVDFEVTYIDLRNKPDWFLEISPHGKVPVLKVDDEILFESNAIAEYLDETVAPRLHPEDAIRRARNRAWTDYVPTFASAMTSITYAKTPEEIDAGIEKAKTALGRLEKALGEERHDDGPYFNGSALSLVDAAYAPFLQRFAMVDAHLQTGLLDGFPRVKSWSDTLLATEVVTSAVAANFVEEYHKNLRRRETHVATLIGDQAAAE